MDKRTDLVENFVDNLSIRFMSVQTANSYYKNYDRGAKIKNFLSKSLENSEFDLFQIEKHEKGILIENNCEVDVYIDVSEKSFDGNSRSLLKKLLRPTSIEEIEEIECKKISLAVKIGEITVFDGDYDNDIKITLQMGLVLKAFEKYRDIENKKSK